MEQLLNVFQSDLGNISSEIQTLQVLYGTWWGSICAWLESF